MRGDARSARGRQRYNSPHSYRVDGRVCASDFHGGGGPRRLRGPRRPPRSIGGRPLSVASALTRIDFSVASDAPPIPYPRRSFSIDAREQRLDAAVAAARSTTPPVVEAAGAHAPDAPGHCACDRRLLVGREISVVST